MKHFLFLLPFIFQNYVANSQVNNDEAFVRGTYNKSSIRLNKIEKIKVDVTIAGNKIARQYNFDTAGNLVHMVTLSKKGQKIYESFSKYNSFGDKFFEKKLDFENNSSDSVFYDRLYNGDKQIKESSKQIGYAKEYYYNNNGQLQKVITNSKNGTSTTTVYLYDKHGNEIELIWSQNGSRKVTKNIYGENGQLMDVSEYYYSLSDTTGSLLLHKKLFYADGKMIKEEYVGGYFMAKENKEYLYDQLGNLITYREGEKESRFTYDTKGNLLTESSIGGITSSVKAYLYVFRK
jgi:YD repeat-containing protein